MAQTYSIEELGRRVRASDPQTFSGFSDQQIGERILQRKPELQSMVSITPSQNNQNPSPLPSSSSSQQPPQEGFVKGLVKSIAKPFLEPTAAAVNAVNAIGSLTKGGFSQQAANQANQNLHTTYNLPFFGEVKPAFTGEESLPESFKKQAGYGAEIASNIVGGEGVGAAGKEFGKQLIKQGIRQGVKYGALTGGLGEFGRSLQDNQGALETAKRTGEGILGGGVVGGALGGVSPLISGAINKIKNPVLNQGQKGVSEALEVIRPQLNKKETQAALQAGRGKISGLFRTNEITPSSRDYDIAQAVEGIVSKKNTTPANINLLHNEIEKDANQVIEGLKQNNAIFNKNQIRSALNAAKQSEDRMLTLAGDEAAEKAYNGAIDVFMKVLDRKPKTLSGLLEARKEFDTILRRAGAFAKDNPKSIAAKDIRQIANNFIDSKLPEGHPFKDLLNRQNLMYEAIENISEKGTRDVGKNALQRLKTKYPNAVKAAGYVAGGGILGKVLSE